MRSPREKRTTRAAEEEEEEEEEEEWGCLFWFEPLSLLEPLFAPLSLTLSEPCKLSEPCSLSEPWVSSGSIQWSTPAAARTSATNGAPPAVRRSSRARADTA